MDNRFVHTDTEIRSGAPVFAGTQVPVHNLWDYLEAGYGLEGFLDGFPSVSRHQAEWVLLQARAGLNEQNANRGRSPTPRNANDRRDEKNTTNAIVHSDPEIMHGAPVFVGTRVPAERLWHSLEGGESLDEFLEGFPSVSREQALGLLEQARELLSGRTIEAAP